MHTHSQNQFSGEEIITVSYIFELLTKLHIATNLKKAFHVLYISTQKFRQILHDSSSSQISSSLFSNMRISSIARCSSSRLVLTAFSAAKRPCSKMWSICSNLLAISSRSILSTPAFAFPNIGKSGFTSPRRSSVLWFQLGGNLFIRIIFACGRVGWGRAFPPACAFSLWTFALSLWSPHRTCKRLKTFMNSAT